MAKRLKLNGMPIDEFLSIVRDSNDSRIFVRNARLIPSVIKSGDELALTSIFLSSVKLIKEFREDIFSEIKFRKSGSHYYFTEPVFEDFKDSRPDGLVLNVVSGKIQDAMILEVKNKNNDLKEDQMERYVLMAKTLGVSKIVSISNQFVLDSSVVPYHIKSVKDVDTYHFSWQYLLTLAHVLLYKNDHNIEDEDQVALMSEIVKFFESKESGIYGFTSMKKGWGAVAKTLKMKGSLKSDSPEVIEAIHSWQQEEKDMALILSRELGLLVRTTGKQNIQERFSADFKKLSDKNHLSSKLRIDGIVSPIDVTAQFVSNSISMSVEVQAPDKTIRGQIGYIRQQLANCSKKNPEKFAEVEEEIWVKPLLKYRNEYNPTPIEKLDDAIDDLKGKEITAFQVSYTKMLNAQFESSKKFVEIIEAMLIDFYSGVVQYLKNPEKKIPQVSRENLNLAEDSV